MTDDSYTYNVVTSDELTHLAKIVNDRLDGGWKLQGGIAYDSSSNEYMQAMIIEEPDESLWDIMDADC